MSVLWEQLLTACSGAAFKLGKWSKCKRIDAFAGAAGYTQWLDSKRVCRHWFFEAFITRRVLELPFLFNPVL